MRKKHHVGVVAEYADVRYFEPSDNMEEHTRYVLNERLHDVRRVYDSIIHKHVQKLTEYQKKISIFEKLCEDGNVLVKIDEMNPIDMARKLQIVEGNSYLLWDAFDVVFGPGFFNKVIEDRILGG